ncbi:MAG: UDP-glucose 4-epimerase GalE [Planctomycetes bacterium]|nr:UDP-glucose 4-epimerase GalE [Planctomycetota bacterium]
MSSGTILVTGGAGYIGSHAVLELRKSGHAVVIFDDLKEGHRAAALDTPVVQGDLCDRDLLVETIRKHQVGAVMHFAARCYVGESVTQPAKYIRDNARGLFELLEAMRACDVKKIVFSSTCAVYGVPAKVPITEEFPRQPISPYGITKRFCEEELEMYCRAYGFSVVAPRYFNAAGADPEGRLGEWHEPETHLIPAVLRSILSGGAKPLEVFGTDYPTPDGTCIRDYVHVADLATAHRLALGVMKPGVFEPVNLGSGRGNSVLEVIAAARTVTGAAVPYQVKPRREGDPPALVGGVEKAKRLLGWTARYVDLAETVQHAWNWLKAHPRGYAS